MQPERAFLPPAQKEYWWTLAAIGKAVKYDILALRFPYCTCHDRSCCHVFCSTGDEVVKFAIPLPYGYYHFGSVTMHLYLELTAIHLILAYTGQCLREDVWDTLP